VSAGPIIFGGVFLLVAIVLLRYPAAVARWQIDGRVEKLRRSSMLNAEYVDREIESLRQPGSYRLSCWLTRGAGVFFLLLAALVLVRGLA
jgi:hypothetical protein